MGSDWVRDVADFHEKYLVDIPNQPEGMLIEAQELHRMKLFLEEFKEFCDAVEKKDFVEYVDAIGDMIYILIGTALSCGVDLRPIWDAIHVSNMKKIPPLHAGQKVRKPDGWEPPKIDEILQNQGWNR